ncbi:hypothetical protein GCM10011586_28540 [Silvibacterium dinghuense]|nr:hypothetical protein GCM10011586_28540 [Silvibacterium dinghuense]
MSREEHRIFAGKRRMAQADRVPDSVDADIGEAEIPKAIAEPFGPGTLFEGRRGDRDQFRLPMQNLRLLEMEPAKGGVDAAIRRNLRHAGESGGGGGGRHESPA